MFSEGIVGHIGTFWFIICFGVGKLWPGWALLFFTGRILF